MRSMPYSYCCYLAIRLTVRHKFRPGLGQRRVYRAIARNSVILSLGWLETLEDIRRPVAVPNRRGVNNLLRSGVIHYAMDRLITSRSSAFTLIELSIVLVIIGLVAGGIVVANSLIEVATMGRLMSDIERYKTSTNAFRSKYNCLPGDCPYATRFWGEDTGCPNSAYSTNKGLVPTCNGNGDGMVGATANDNLLYECFRFWQQLSNAGLIDQQFTGRKSYNSGFLSDYWIGNPGLNVPLARGTNMGMYLVWRDDADFYAPEFYFPGNYQHAIVAHIPLNFAFEGWRGSMKTSQLQSLDAKYDDAAPGTGNIVSFTPTSSELTCATTDNPLTARYDLSNTRNVCVPVFRNLF
jgi:prepilin-type N-terminal cleavage/methylation domain-containing protein